MKPKVLPYASGWPNKAGIPKRTFTVTLQNVKQAITSYLSAHGFEALCPKAVLFDMDGVLYNSMPHHAVAWEEAMRKFGIRMTALDAYATEGARGVDTIVNMVKQQLGKDISLDEAQEMYDEKSRIFHAMPETKVFPGVTELMEAITSAGLQVGVVTGSGQRSLINRLLTDFFRFLSPDHIVSAYDVERGKPYPDPYLQGLKKLGNLAPHEAFVVENAPLGVRAGVAAEVFTIAVNTGPLPDEALIREGCNILFHSMQELADNFQALLAAAAK